MKEQVTWLQITPLADLFHSQCLVALFKTVINPPIAEGGRQGGGEGVDERGFFNFSWE